MRKYIALFTLFCVLFCPVLLWAKPILAPSKVVYRGTLTGLRISSVDGTAFIDNAGSSLSLALSKVLATGSVTQANMRISAVDGKAFIDTADATFSANITGNTGKYLRITDSTGKAIEAWIKAAGESEGLGDELITNGTFASDVSGWTNHATYSFDTVQLSSGAMNVISDGSGTTWCSVYQTASISVTAGQMYKFTLDRTVNSGGTPITAFENNPIGTSLVGSPLGTGTSYRTITATDSAAYYNHYIAGATATNFTVDNISLKIVTAPSSSGVTLVNTKDGTTFNFVSKETGFNYNDSSGYTYTVYDRDLSALADGNHQISIFDASGRELRGVLKAAGTSESLDSEGLANPGFETAGAGGADVFGSWTESAGTGTIADETTIVRSDSHAAKITRGTDDNLIRQDVSGTAETLYKFVVYSRDEGTSPIRLRFLSLPSAAIIYNTYTGSVASDTWTAQTKYMTVPVSETGVRIFIYGPANNGTTIYADDGSWKQQTAPSSSGATIVSAKEGSTQNFSLKTASFTYNATSYYVIVRKLP